MLIFEFILLPFSTDSDARQCQFGCQCQRRYL